ncbi:class I SAM-dependent methyltransferase [Microlunatus sp. GCM10028923]|uniref:class I SAM-dependent methyltransferase n=1 Tax=Microlunatus sp. GCM10028923 TaxID=3273400 RepID=UPI00361BFE3C
MPASASYRTVPDDPEPDRVRRITLLLLLPEGECVVAADGGPALSTSDVAAGEHWLYDTTLRVPQQTHGFRIQGMRTVAVADLDPADPAAGLQVFGFATGAPAGREVALEHLTPDRLAARLAAAGDPVGARFVVDAAEARQARTDAQTAADNLRWQAAYLRADTPWGQSGNSGTLEDWERSRRPVAEAIERDGTFLDVGCANGYLMECVQAWCAERGIAVEPYGMDLGADLIRLARQRLPHWADRLWVGNMQTWTAPGGLRFDTLQVRPDAVLLERRADLLTRLRADLLTDGGRLIVTMSEPGPYGTAPALLEQAGFTVAGVRGHVAWADA